MMVDKAIFKSMGGVFGRNIECRKGKFIFGMSILVAIKCCLNLDGRCSM